MNLAVTSAPTAVSGHINETIRSCGALPAGRRGAKRCHNGEVASIANTEAESKSRILRELTIYFLLAYGMSLVLWLPVLIGGNVLSAFLSLGTVGPTLAAWNMLLESFLNHSVQKTISSPA